jgi:hypothetical protein
MRGFGIKRTTALQALALASLALALPLASQAATGSNETRPGPPLVSTGGVGHVNGTSAVLEGSIDPRTLPTIYYFKYGPTTAYGQQTTPASLPAGTTRVKVAQAVTGFLSGYHYRLVATNAQGPKEGKDRTYTTKITKRKKSGFELPKSFEPTVLGGTFILSGTLTGADNAMRSIVLQASPYPYRAAFANVGVPILTGATGSFSFRVGNLSTSTRFRVATVGPTPLYSLVLTEQVAVRVTLKARTTSHRGLVRLYGTVTPAEVGAHLFIQLEKTKTAKAPKGEKPDRPEKPGKSEKSEKSEEKPTFSTKFSGRVKKATKTISRFSVIVNIQDAGTYRVFVEVPPGPVASGHSQSITLKAPGKKTKGKKQDTSG